MRHILSVSAVAVLCALAGAAAAQQRPGWVDPPARDAPEAEQETAPEARRTSPAANSDEDREETRQPSRRAARRAPPREAPVAEAPPPRLRERATVQRPAPRRAAPPRTTGAPPLDFDVNEAPPAAMDARFPDWAATAQRLSDAYLDTVSAPGETMVVAAPRFYGERVQFHGRSMSLPALLSEKRRFVRRWPERRYEPLPGATRTACNAASATCVVRTTIAFAAANPASGARSEGLSELVLTISFAGPRPIIVSETSRVMRRAGSSVSGLPAARGA